MRALFSSFVEGQLFTAKGQTFIFDCIVDNKNVKAYNLIKSVSFTFPKLMPIETTGEIYNSNIHKVATFEDIKSNPTPENVFSFLTDSLL